HGTCTSRCRPARVLDRGGTMGRSGGFTQMEVLVCVGLATILGVIAIPELTAWGDVARAHGAASSLATELRNARARALVRGRTLTVRFDPSASSWETRDAQGGLIDGSHLPPRLAFSALPQNRLLHFGATGRSDNGTVALSCGTSTVRVVVNQR